MWSGTVTSNNRALRPLSGALRFTLTIHSFSTYVLTPAMAQVTFQVEGLQLGAQWMKAAKILGTRKDQQRSKCILGQMAREQR